MQIPGNIVDAAWERCGDQCECEDSTHDHTGRCKRPLVSVDRSKSSHGAWDVYKFDPHGSNSLDNCIILCWFCRYKFESSPGR